MAGVGINEKAPLFGLSDFSGRMVNLADFQGDGNILLVFNRGFM